MSYDRQRSKQLHLPLAAVGIGLGLGAAAVAVAFASRNQRAPLEPAEWQEALDGLGRIKDPGSLLKQIADKGMHPSIRKDVWPFLVGVFPLTSTEHDRNVLVAQLKTAYAQLLEQCQDLESGLADAMHLAQVSSSHSPDEEPQLPPHLVQFGEAHRIIVLDAVRTDFKHRAYPVSTPSSSVPPPPPSNPVASALQGAAKFVNGWAAAHFTQPHDTSGMSPAAQRDAGSLSRVGEGLADGTEGQVGEWVSRVAQQTIDGCDYLDVYRRRQARRLVSVLSAYAVYDPETGYCQGMSDLAAPFLVVLEDEALAFWCFAALMSRARGNFAMDESGMWNQLRALGGILERWDRPLHHRLRQLGAVECHFAYRMVVVMMRREMSMDRAMLMWEIIWADALLSQMTRQSRSSSETVGWAPHLPGTGPPTLASRVLYRATSVTSEASVSEDGEWGLFLYVVAAVVCMHRRQVLDDCRDHDHVLQLFSTVRVDVWAALSRGRKMREALQASSDAGGSVRGTSSFRLGRG